MSRHIGLGSGLSVVFYYIMLGFMENTIDQYMNYMHKGYAKLQTLFGLIWSQNVSDDV